MAEDTSKQEETERKEKDSITAIAECMRKSNFQGRTKIRKDGRGITISFTVKRP